MSESAGTVAFDSKNLDPATIAGMSMEDLDALATTGQSTQPTSTPAATDAKPEGEKPAGQTQEGTQAADKKDVEGASSGASEAGDATKTDDKELNFGKIRAKAHRLEQELAETQRQNEELQRKLEANGKAAVETVDLNAIDKRIGELRAKAAELAEEAPSVSADYAQAADDLLRMGLNLVQSNKDHKARIEADQKKQQDEIRDESQAAINANPVLSHWEKNDVEAFNLAADQDNILRGLPEWKDKPLAARFEQAVAIVKMMRPNASLPEAPPQGEKKTEAAPEKKPAAAPAGASPVTSLSDIPGGIPPAKNELENASELSSAALGNKFLSMSREQQDAYLASLEATT